MERLETALPGVGMIGKILFPILAIVALYYLYQFLFGPSDLMGKDILNGGIKANPDKPLTIQGAELPPLLEGGEYSVNFWIYVDDYGYNLGRNKPILSLGDFDQFLTLIVFLGPYKNSLNVRVHTQGAGEGAVAKGSPTPSPADNADNLSKANLENLFGNLQQDTGLLNTTRMCDIPSIDLQKWIQVTITLNTKICDVYIDGKLARSCILPSFFRVSPSYSLRLCDRKGFGGYVANASAYNYALNPEQIWKLYMSGPGPQYSLLDYLKSLFDPSALGSFDYPKQNIVG
jgi:hypothetical protein